MLRIITALLTPLVLAGLAAAQNPLPAPPPREALLFKSGQSFLYRELALEADSRSARLLLPRATHGTAWLGAEGFEIIRARAGWQEREIEEEVRDLTGTLRMSLGKMVRLSVMEGTEITTVTGLVQRFLGETAKVPAGATPTPATPRAVVIQRHLGGAAPDRPRETIVLPLNRIVGVTLLGKDAVPWRFQARVEVPVLDVELKPEAGGTKRLGLATMAQGLSWAPSYVLTLGDEDKARLVGKAVVMNDLEDLRDTEVRLVVGYPNLRFAGVPSSLLPDLTFDAFRNLMMGGADQDLGNSLSQVMSNPLSNFAMTQATPARPSGPLAPTPGESAEDLYVYSMGQQSLEKGERAYLPLLESEVSCTHRYDWELPDRVDRYARFVQQNQEAPIPLWHVLLLQNGTTAPWTTAPVLIRSQKGPLAQSQIDYTPRGSECTVRLTQALNLVGDTLEYRSDDAQADREEVRLFGNRYELITVKGQLELANRGDRPAPVRITKQISGDVLSSTGDPKIKGRAKSLGQVNASRELTWEFELAPDATWKAEYLYRVLIRR